MKNFRWWGALGLLIASAMLASCGGGGGGNGNVRLVNATISHPSIDLVSSTDSSVLISDVKTNTVSGYVGIGSGSPTLQINDSGSSTSLVGTSPSLTSGQHLAIIAYEVDGIVQPAYIAEDTTALASGNSAVRIIDLAVDAGGLNIYLLAQGTALTSSTTPTFSITAPSQITATNSLSFSPGTYTLYVTGQGSVSDLRLTISSLTLGDTQNNTVILTPTTGGVLVNGGLLVQQADYTASSNTTARVRLAAAAANGSAVTLKSGSVAVASNVTSPSVSQYALVPAASSTLSVTVDGAAVTVPTTLLTAGTDSTVLVYNNAGVSAAKVLADDNHGSSTIGDARVRLVNALTGTAPNLTFKVAFSILDTAVEPDTASGYFDVLAGSQIQIDALSGTSAQALFSQLSTLQSGKVYTVFMFGDTTTPVGDIVQDSPN